MADDTPAAQPESKPADAGVANGGEPEAPRPDVEGGAPGKVLSPAAKRALEEAAERRRKAKDEDKKKRPKEIDGRDGPEPTRYGDWENKGTAVDFS